MIVLFKQKVNFLFNIKPLIMTAVSVKTLEELKKTLLRRTTCVYQILLIYRTSLKLGGLNHKELRQNFPF